MHPLLNIEWRGLWLRIGCETRSASRNLARPLICIPRSAPESGVRSRSGAGLALSEFEMATTVGGCRNDSPVSRGASPTTQRLATRPLNKGEDHDR